MRKMITFPPEPRRTQDSGRRQRQDFQDLIDEAIARPAEEHKRPVTLTEMLRGSLARAAANAKLQPSSDLIGRAIRGTLRASTIVGETRCIHLAEGVLDPQGPSAQRSG